ncbi:linear gramicidin synthase subunit D-like [Patiria miniata]|uniref:Fatty acid synthase n=1 Tax=Patiria miniata TaxID=46514 RepID=A0A913ZVV4_PATMI|nr:linear gramicidin synthase subunit D-like [Patiria miniata]
MDYEMLGCLQDMFRRQAKMLPDSNAIVTDDGQTMTYKELDEVTDVLAAHLHGKGVVGDSIVGIYLEKCLEYPIAYIAILKAGGAYLPLDISYPQQLLDDVLQDAKPVSVITFTDLVPRLKGAHDVTVLDANWSIRMKDENIKRGLHVSMCPQVTQDNLAFVAYSSGTTGKPKGIMCVHRAAVFSYHWRHINYPFQQGDRIACNVFFVWEMLRPLLKGFPLYIIPDDVIYDPALLLSFLERHSITRMLFTPSLLATVLDTDNVDIATCLGSFRLIVLCGEVVTVGLMARIAEILPDVTVMNLYSVSETHDVAATNLTLEMKNLLASGSPEKTQKFCPAGRLLPGAHVVILNDEMELQPVGSSGEIYVGGPGLARGYLNRPEMNAKRFISRPESVPEYAGDRLYRSGDWGYMLSDGHLEICGRCDTMVKIRGYSIEIQAVEAALLDLPMVSACTVLAKGAEGDDKYLVAYIVQSEATSKKDIRSALKTIIPSYMVPAYIVFLTSMPLLPASGKLDKKALPDFNPETADFAPVNGEQGKPCTETEKTVSGMWSDLLRISNVDVQESFFDLGGHSLLAARLLNQIKDGFGVEMTVRELFIHSTVAQMSTLIDSKIVGDNVDQSLHHNINLHEEVEQHDQGIVSIDMQLRAFWRSIHYGDRWNAGRVLLTGATGFLGAFILRDLLIKTENHIYCLVKELPDLSGKDRLLATMRQYNMLPEDDSHDDAREGTPDGSDLLAKFDKRVTAITGDVSLIRLGMMEEDYTYLTFEIDSVIHAAAYVNLVYPYEALRGANVIGTQNIVLFSCTNKIKPLHYVSTNSVFPVGLKNCCEDSDMSTFGDQLTDGYSQSKWVAEQLVQRAQSRGLPAVIYRPGNLSGDSVTGAWNPSDTNLLTLQGCIRTLSAPDIKWLIEMTPVDFASEFIVKACQNVMLVVGKVYHLVHSAPLKCRTLFEWIADLGYPLRLMPFHEWCNELKQLHHGVNKEDSVLADKLDNIVKNESFFMDYTSFHRANLETLLATLQMSYPPLDKRLIRGYLQQLFVKKILMPPMSLKFSSRPLEGKVVVITGGSSGIGLGIAKCLAQAGASVALAARHEEKLEQARLKIAEIGGKVLAVKTDVCIRQQVKDLVAKTEAELGPVDILVNNAGIMHFTLMKNLLEDSWERMVDVNCKGVLNGIGAVLSGMIARGKGHIVNTSSDAGRAAFAGLAVYSGSKFFVEGLTSSLRKELVGTGIRVTNIQPGDVTSAIADHIIDKEAVDQYANIDVDKFLSPDDIGRAVLYAVTQPEGVAVNEILIEPTDFPAV